MENFPWKNISYAVIAIVVSFLASLGFRAYNNRPTPPAAVVVDSDLQKDIEQALASSDSYAREKIAVTVKDGEATLTGTVHEQWKQSGAANVAAVVPGVKLVNNFIKVSEIHQKESAPWSGSAEASSSGAEPAKPARMITQTPEDKAQALIEQGQAELRRKDYDGAIKDFQAALEIQPGNYEAQSGLQEAKNLR